jgi:hypothetical protein
MTYLTAYLAGIVAMFAVFAYRNNFDDIRSAFFVCMIWPLSIVLASAIYVLEKSEVHVRTSSSPKRFGYRKPLPASGVKGFAIAAFGTELQIFKKV